MQGSWEYLSEFWGSGVDSLNFPNFNFQATINLSSPRGIERSFSVMKNKWLVILLVLAFCGVCSFPAMAQDQSSARGNLSGLVYDSTKALVPGAQVTITGPIGSQTQTTTVRGSALVKRTLPSQAPRALKPFMSQTAYRSMTRRSAGSEFGRVPTDLSAQASTSPS